MTYARACLRTLILILALVLSQSAKAFQNEPNDCRGIVWGTDYGELKGLTKVTTQNSLDYYTRRNDEMTFGDAPLEMVVYVFYEKKFCGAILNFKSSPDFETIKTILFDRYGKGRQANRYEETYKWYGTSVNITLEYDDITEKGKVIYYYVPIYQKMQKTD